jgi:hypothetical protein
MNFATVNEQMDAIRRDALEVIPEEALEKKLERSLRTGTPLRVKQGFDPTRPDLHIGHAVSIRKLRTFQELGHEVIFVVGDYTARVGDPSGRSETRPRLTPEEISANAETYAQQVGRILDMASVRLEFNSRWLAPLDLAKLLELTATYTVARMLERDDFAKRYAEQRPISVMEFMYPLMQAYDSVALHADVELGGYGPEVQPAGRPDRAGTLRPGAAGLPGHAAAPGHGRRAEDVEVVRQLHRHRGAGYGAVRQDHVHSRRAARGMDPHGSAAAAGGSRRRWRRRRRIRTAPSARWAGASLHSITETPPPKRPSRISTGCSATTRRRSTCPNAAALDDERLRVAERGGVWLPGLLVAAGVASSNGEAGRLISRARYRWTASAPRTATRCCRLSPVPRSCCSAASGSSCASC